MENGGRRKYLSEENEVGKIETYYEVGEKMKRIFYLIGIGIVTGTIFGLLLKIIQGISGKKVYTLLLNVDYIPWFRDREFSEFVEFSFHLAVSILVVILLYGLFKRMSIAYKKAPYIFSSGFIAFMLFATTSFSLRTPDVLDAAAFGWWFIAHLIYGWLVGWCIQKTIKKEAV